MNEVFQKLFLVLSVIFLLLSGYFTTTVEKDAASGKWQIDVSVEAEEVGTASNVGRNALVIMNPKVPEVDSVLNRLAITSGTDDETNADLTTRILASVEGSSVGTTSGYEDLGLAFHNRKIILGGSPTIKGLSEIEREMKLTDQRVFLIPCPICREYQLLKYYPLLLH